MAFAEIADGPLGAGKAALAVDNFQGEVGGVILAEDLLAFREEEDSRTRMQCGKVVVRNK